MEYEMIKACEGEEQFYFDLLRDSNKKVASNYGLEWKKNRIYQLTFNDLTAREDLGNLDQAKETIDEASKVFEGKTGLNKLKSYLQKANKEDNKKSSQLRLRLKQMNLDRIKTLLNVNKEFEELTCDAAISKLRDHSTFLNKIYISSSYDVDMEVLQGNGLRESYSNKQINKLLDIVKAKSLSDTSLRFNLVFKQSNRNAINEYYKNNLSGIMHVAFDRMDYTMANKLLANIKVCAILDCLFLIHLNIIVNNLILKDE